MEVSEMMDEIEPENDLFATNERYGLGGASLGRATCGLCGRVVNPDADTPEDPDYTGSQWFREFWIGDVRILDCCFPKVEQVFLYLAMGTNALPWLAERLEEKAGVLQRKIDSLEEKQQIAETITALLRS
jgi:hypothetical protein